MTTLDLRFRKLLLKNIAKMRSNDLDRYDSVLALRAEFIEQLQTDGLADCGDVEADGGDVETDGGGVEKPPTPLKELARDDDQELQSQIVQHDPLPSRPVTELSQAIRMTSDESEKIIRPFFPRFRELHKLYMARRRLAVQQGHLLQIPTTFPALGKLIREAINYQVVQVWTLVRVAPLRLKDFLADWRKVVAVCVLLGVLAVFLWLILMKPEQGHGLK